MRTSDKPLCCKFTDNPGRRMRVVLFLIGSCTVWSFPSSARAQFATVYGGPTFDTTTQVGYAGASVPAFGVGNGTAVGGASKLDGITTFGHRAFRLDTSGLP